MNTTDNNQHHELVDRHSKGFLSGGSFRWERSQADIREELLQKIAERPHTRVIRLNPVWIAAASLALLVGITAFLRFFTTTVATPAGVHQLALLPDGSQVELNAQSTLSYHPLWWFVERKLTFEGEAFFKVEKGKNFKVESARGTTQVLGTSFNIFSRDQLYRVTCASGKVRVSSSPGNQAVLLPNSRAEVLPDGQIEVVRNVDLNSEISWRNNIFLFTATPLPDVFREIERQYAVTIEMKVNSYDLYTGNFTRSQKIEEVLSFVCPAAGLTFKKKSDNVYLVLKDLN
ncbi:MAG: FecR family protein [Mangrovibacterium sp.]